MGVHLFLPEVFIQHLLQQFCLCSCLTNIIYLWGSVRILYGAESVCLAFKVCGQ